MDWGEWIIFTPAWVDFSSYKEYGRSKLDSSGDPGLVHRKEEADNTRDTDPQIRFMEKFRKFFNPEFQ